MDKDIREYLHYYLGCDFWTPNSQGNLNDKTLHHIVALIESGVRVQLLLRKLESMTEQEWQEIRFHLSADIVASVPLIKWQDRPRWVVVLENRVQTNTLRFLDGIELIKRGYDLFQWIDAGLALDKETIKS